MSDIDSILDIRHHFGGGVYAKQALIRAGWCAQQHVHEYDHLSIAHGHVVVEIEGEPNAIEYVGTNCILIEAGKVHKVTALKDSMWFCIHATDETDPEKVDDVILHQSERGE